MCSKEWDGRDSSHNLDKSTNKYLNYAVFRSRQTSMRKKTVHWWMGSTVIEIGPFINCLFRTSPHKALARRRRRSFCWRKSMNGPEEDGESHTNSMSLCQWPAKGCRVDSQSRALPSFFGFLFIFRALPDFISALFTATAANGNNLIALLMCLDWKNNFFRQQFFGISSSELFLSHSSSRQHIMSVHNNSSEDKEEGLLAQNEN